MQYNELKVRTLGLFESKKELDSAKVRRLLAQEKTVNLTDKAVEMALMRYYRQGLLTRARRGRLFQYSLTERGATRLAWLLKQ